MSRVMRNPEALAAGILAAVTGGIGSMYAVLAVAMSNSSLAFAAATLLGITVLLTWFSLRSL